MTLKSGTHWGQTQPGHGQATAPALGARQAVGGELSCLVLLRSGPRAPGPQGRAATGGGYKASSSLLPARTRGSPMFPSQNRNELAVEAPSQLLTAPCCW